MPDYKPQPVTRLPEIGPQIEPASTRVSLPFDYARLDELMEASGADILLVTSRHNIQYLLGGYRFFFFDRFDALGISRYLPILVYPKGRPDNAVYIGNSMEESEAENGRFWCPTVETSCWGTLDATGLAIKHVRALAGTNARIGVELAFFPTDASDMLRAAFPRQPIVDAHLALERLRAVKSAHELHLLREASQRVVAAMAAVFCQLRPGLTKRTLADLLRSEETTRGLEFDYCLITAGTSFNRAPSDQVIRPRDIISLDSGGSLGGYIGDLCRMGIAGEPDSELQDLLAWIETIQQAARRPIAPGCIGCDIFAAVDDLWGPSPNRAHTHFVAHGMGMIGHEAPRLTDAGPVTYPASDAERPLLAGMVLSLETTMKHPRRGYIKLEDTVAVTHLGCVGFGDSSRGWNTADTSAG